MVNFIVELDNMKINFKNFLTLILILGLIFIVSVNILNSDRKNSSEPKEVTLSKKEFKNMLAADTKRISLFVEAIQKIPQEMADILGFQEVSPEEIKIIQNSILFNSPEIFATAVAFEPYQFNKDAYYSSFYLHRKEDTICHTTLNDPDYDYFYWDWYLIPKIRQKPFWSAPYYDDGGGNMIMTTYSVPFYSFDGFKEKFAGIVTVDISIEWLSWYLINQKKLPEGNFKILLSENGTIISARNKDWIFNETIFSLSLLLDTPELREIGRDLQRGKSGIKKFANPLDTKNITIFYATIKANKWGLLYAVPEKG